MIEIPQVLNAKSPAILFSGGKDSLLLLDAARKLRPDITIVHFYEHLHPAVETVFKEWELEAISWRPSTTYLIPWSGDIALVGEYSFSGVRLPVLRDVVKGDRCGFHHERKRTDYFDYPWDITLWGMKKCDELHPVMPPHFKREVQLGPTTLIAPLYEMSDNEVLTEISRREIPYSPFADTVTACDSCYSWLKSDWDSNGALDFFAKRFGYREAA